MKIKKIRSFAFKVIIVCLIVIIMVSGWQLYKAFEKYYKARIQYNDVIKTSGSVNVKGTFTGEIDWQSLLSQNEDIRAWVYLKDTIINYPVVRGSDNSFYLTHMFNKAYNGAGSLFMDANAPDNFEGFNTVIYGHHMRDGSMFALLEKYKSQEFYENNKQLELITPSAKYHLIVVGFELVYSESDAYKYNFIDDKEKQALIEYTEKNNLIKVHERANIKDRLVTLSTCAYEATGDRYVLVTKMVPWTKSELKAAIDEQKAIESSSIKEKEDKSTDNKKINNKDSLIDNIKLGFKILKDSLLN